MALLPTNRVNDVNQEVDANDINAICAEVNRVAALVTSAALKNTIDLEVADWLPGNGYVKASFYNDGDPVPTGGGEDTLLIALTAGAAAPVFTVVSNDKITTDASSFTIPSLPAAPAGAYYFIHVHADAAAGAADYPTAFTGAGTTWTSVGSQKVLSGNGASRVYRSAVAPTGGAITATYGASMANFTYRVVQVTGLDPASPIAQAQQGQFANTTPGLTLTGVDPNNPILAFYMQQSAGQTATVGSGYTELGVQQSSTDAPVFLTDAMYRNDGATLVNWVASDVAQKVILAMELNAA